MRLDQGSNPNVYGYKVLFLNQTLSCAGSSIERVILFVATK